MAFKNDAGNTVLVGDGTYPWSVEVDGNDLVVRNVRATWFGGDNDPNDNGDTASGEMTKHNPGIMGCALPLNTGPCKGSALPVMPWIKTVVQVFSHESGHVLKLPLIDLGPAPPPHAHAAIDLTQAAFVHLSPDNSTERGELTVDYRVINGALYLKG